MASIWVPRSHEYREAWDVHKAVRRYDENLAFGRNEETGQWCIFMRQGTGEAASNKDLPILGFNHIPEVNEAIDRLERSDARRRGQEIIKELQAHNEDIQQERERRAQEAEGEAAAALAWGFRKQGFNPFPRIFVPGR